MLNNKAVWEWNAAGNTVCRTKRKEETWGQVNSLERSSYPCQQYDSCSGPDDVLVQLQETRALPLGSFALCCRPRMHYSDRSFMKSHAGFPSSSYSSSSFNAAAFFCSVNKRKSGIFWKLLSSEFISWILCARVIQNLQTTWNYWILWQSPWWRLSAWRM
jgi:hypothetical protein